ncbi:MAG: hypothetical protein FE042_02600 [Thermoplasmata archaeon]|nr:MAG: hypothetical protein FE042_02600 [Thermoplasmata archaeon]
MNRYGVVGIVEAVLLIGLFAIVLATLQIAYIPELMKSREAEHMDEVMNQFFQLKMAVDLHAVSRSNFSITVPLTLGSRELPYFVTTRAIGSVSIIENAFKISIQNATGYTNLSLGIIKYEAKNAYYVPQTYVFENEAIILSQDDGTDSLLSPPTINVNRAGNLINMNLLVINITGYANRTSESGVDTTYIRTNYSSYSSINISDVSNLTIFTSHPEPWFRFLNYTMDDVVITKHADRVQVKPESGYQMNIYLDIVNICAQIGRGWIGNI